MKVYTDLEQSRILAGILPIESADMFYRDNGIDVKLMWEHNAQKVTTPCWSLAALLGVLPTTIGNFFEKNALGLRMDKGENDFNIWYEKLDCGYVAEGLDVIEDNPIDACVEMIIKLHEQKLL